VVVDGYRDAPSEMLHINMGWGGSYDGWYVPDSFITGSSNWTATAYQGAAIGIQPDKTPEPVIKANGKDNSSVTASTNSPVSIDLSLEVGEELGKQDDWWVVMSSPSGYFSWIYPTGWVPGIITTGQIAMSDFSSYEIFDSLLSPGDYTFFFGVDENPDGNLDEPFFYDYVTVHVVDADTLSENPEATLPIIP